MNKRILFCATVDYHFKAFHLPYLKWFKEQGWEVHVAASGDRSLPYTDYKHVLPIERSPFSTQNVRAYFQLKKLIDTFDYDLIHCHTPVGGMLGRIAALNARKKGTKVLYTAHGYHFCKGAPFMNWLIYYPLEWGMSFLTDAIITINKEDYQLSKNQFHAAKILKVHGVGVDTAYFHPPAKHEKDSLKKSFGFKPGDFLCFYAAEFNRNKNQSFLINAFALVKEKVPHAKLLLAGEGDGQKECRALVEKLNLSDSVAFLGFRKDIKELVQASDVGVASSLREGLPVNVMEMMAAGLPVIAIKNRGHNELIENGKTGFLLSSDQVKEFAGKVIYLEKETGRRELLGFNAREKIINTYSVQRVLQEKTEIYKSFMTETEAFEWIAR
ncbi:glycosyltransferase family 4 protein [Jeotgalibacillus aurantiacus]|uniref:glycosyltransferase family 4 protein n=1 Tax=Jeotgalibacillus aurantiacus TaxID=2763266 RepID=UPI001D0A4DC4|nr:glycosyltransferase family 4 protein [Jeotgalibacillus aurantiacus]